MKKDLFFSTKKIFITLLLCTLTLLGWSSTFTPAASKNHVALAPTDTQRTTTDSSDEVEVIDQQSLDELEITKIATTLDCTITHLGNTTFTNALKHPKTDRSYLIKLKNTIKLLLANQELTNRLTTLLRKIKKLEPMISVLLLSKDSIYDAEKQQEAPIPPLTNINKIIEKLLGQGAPTIPVDSLRTIKNPLCLNLAFLGLTGIDFTAIGLGAYWFYDKWSTNHQAAPSTNNQNTSLWNSFYRNLFAPAVYLPLIWVPVSDFWQRRQTTTLVKNHLSALFAFVEQLRTINTLLKETPYLLDIFPELNLVTTFIEKPETLSADLQKISAHANYVSWLPSDTWCTYNTVKVEQKTMHRIFQTIGIIDFIASLATLYKKFQSSRTTFCFVTYEQPATPCLNLQKAWHPLLDSTKVVSNDIVIDKSFKQAKIILTGPNKGKSTTIKLMALIAVLAQTIAIVPASAASLPIIDYIGVNTTTAIPDKVSESQAEINRMRTILDRVAQLDPNKISFTGYDRLMRMEDLAKTYNYSIAQGLTKYPNNISIIATNNPSLKKLEQETQGIFTNFKITSTFKLEPGTSSENYDAPWPDDFLPTTATMARTTHA